MGTKDEILNGGAVAGPQGRTGTRQEAASGAGGTNPLGDEAQEARLRSMGTDVRIPEARPETYAEMYRRLNPHGLPTAAEEERERRERTLASIGDGISALSNLFFTTRYAPNMYDPRNSQYAAVSDRWARLKKEREENRRRYVDGYMRALSLDNMQAIRRQKAEAAGKSAGLADELTRERINGQRANNEFYSARADRERAAADNAPGLEAAKTDAQKAAAEQRRMAGQAAVTRAGKSGGSGRGARTSGSVGEFNAWDRDGRQHRFRTAKAAEQFSREQGTWKDNYSTSTSRQTGSDGRPVGLGTTRTSVHGGHSVNPKKSAKSRFSIHQ